MDWLEKNIIILILQAVITIVIAMRARSDAKRQKEIDSKVDKTTVSLKFKQLESDINHEKELRSLSHDQQIKEIGEIKTLLTKILDKVM